MSRAAKKLLVAWFADEHDVVDATRAVRAAGLAVHDVYTPYAVHGLEEAMGLAPSRLTWVCLGCGIAGLLGGWWLQAFTSAISWPLNVGGKPFHSLPAFIPVIFECTVLLAGLGTVAALLLRSRLRPRLRPRLALERVTDDRFALAIEAAGDRFNLDAARALCAARHAVKLDLLEVPE